MGDGYMIDEHIIAEDRIAEHMIDEHTIAEHTTAEYAPAVRKLRLMTIVGTRPEIIKMSEIIKKCDRYFEQILVHTGQNYDYALNEVFFQDLGIRAEPYACETAAAFP